LLTLHHQHGDYFEQRGSGKSPLGKPKGENRVDIKRQIPVTLEKENVLGSLGREKPGAGNRAQLHFLTGKAMGGVKRKTVGIQREKRGKTHVLPEGGEILTKRGVVWGGGRGRPPDRVNWMTE